MRRWLSRIFTTEPYTEATTRARARVIYGISMVIIVTYTLYGISVPQWTINGVTMPLLQAIITVGTINLTAILFLSQYVFFISAILFTRQGQLNGGALSLIALWYISGVLLSIYALPDISDSGVAMLMFVLLTALLYLERGLYLGFPAVIATIFIAFGLRTIERNELVAEELARSIVVSINMAGGSLLLYLFLHFFRISVREEVSGAVEERVTSGHIVSQVTQLVAQRATSNTLLKGIVGLITDSFSVVETASIFLLDETGNQAELVVDTGIDVEKQPRKIRVFVGSSMPVGQVLETGVPKITENVSHNTTEAVFPLRIGSRTIGALQMQGAGIEFFKSPNVISTFEALSDGLALAIDNVRQFERAEARLRENERLFESSQNALREVERLNQRLIGQAWTDYLDMVNDAPGLSVDFENNKVQILDSWTQTLQEAAEINQLVQNQDGERQIVAIPLRVRGQVIGAMEFELDSKDPFTPEHFDLMQDVSERVGLAAENTRLVLESQRLAQREAVVNQISTRLQSANSVQTALVEAARGLREALKAEKISIRLGEPPDAKPSKKNGTKAE